MAIISSCLCLLRDTIICKSIKWLRYQIQSYLKEEKLLLFSNGLEDLLVNVFVDNDRVLWWKWARSSLSWSWLPPLGQQSQLLTPERIPAAGSRFSAGSQRRKIPKKPGDLGSTRKELMDTDESPNNPSPALTKPAHCLNTSCAQIPPFHSPAWGWGAHWAYTDGGENGLSSSWTQNKNHSSGWAEADVAKDDTNVLHPELLTRLLLTLLFFLRS